MTDLDALLSQAAQSPVTPPSERLVDADVARGHRALVHRKMRRTGTRSALAAVVAVGTFAAVHTSSGSSGSTVAKAPSTTQTSTSTTAALPKAADLSIKLVAYTGTQPDGYTVDSVPAGWEIQGVNNYNLDIAPVASTDQDLNSFVGKIVVMLQSNDATSLTAAQGNTVAVGNGTGIVSNFDRKDGLQLNYKDAASGKWVMVQAPLSLHWTDTELGQFAAGIHVSASAEAGNG